MYIYPPALTRHTTVKPCCTILLSPVSSSSCYLLSSFYLAISCAKRTLPRWCCAKNLLASVFCLLLTENHRAVKSTLKQVGPSNPADLPLCFSSVLMLMKTQNLFENFNNSKAVGMNLLMFLSVFMKNRRNRPSNARLV